MCEYVAIDIDDPVKTGDLVARSQALLEAAGFTVLELVHPIRGTYQLVALTGQHPGLLLVAVVNVPPDPLAPRLGLPGGFPPHTRRLVHCWGAEALPRALILA